MQKAGHWKVKSLIYKKLSKPEGIILSGFYSFRSWSDYFVRFNTYDAAV